MRNSFRAGRHLLLAVTTFLSGLAAGLLSTVERAGSQPEQPVRIGAIAIVTERFPEMLAFYRDVLGFELKALDRENHFAELSNEGVRFQLTTRKTMKLASGSPRFEEDADGQPFELAFQLADPGQVDRLYARIVGKGATAVAAPADKSWGQRVAFFADPDGNVHDLFAER